MQPRLFQIDTALLTRRCVIRRFREHEGAALLELVRESQDYLYNHYPALGIEVGTEAATAEVFVRRRIAAWLLQEDYALGAWANDTTELIGYLHLTDINWTIPSANLRFFVHPRHLDAGYTPEILARTLQFAFRQLELEKVYFTVLSDNYTDQRLARKVGFVREGDLRNEFRKGSGVLVDVIRFGLSREVYGQ